MDFKLNEDQQIFHNTVTRFARTELAPKASERAASEDYPWDVAAKFADMGLLGILFAEEDGGMGGSLVEAILAIQAVAQACPKSGDVIQAANFGPVRTFVEYATSEQKARYLSDILAGKALISLGMTEPDAGSAVTELATTAMAEGDDFIINGTKIFGTHSSLANLFLVYVRFGPGTDGIGSVLIERGTPGFEIGRPSAFMNGEDWSPLYFDNVRIPKENVLLGAGGFRKQIAGFNVERLGNAARAVAVGRHAFTLARDHALTRKQFGRPLSEFQGLQWKFAEMELKLEAAQLLLMRAAVNSAGGIALGA